MYPRLIVLFIVQSYNKSKKGRFSTYIFFYRNVFSYWLRLCPATDWERMHDFAMARHEIQQQRHQRTSEDFSPDYSTTFTRQMTYAGSHLSTTITNLSSFDVGCANIPDHRQPPKSLRKELLKWSIIRNHRLVVARLSCSLARTENIKHSQTGFHYWDIIRENILSYDLVSRPRDCMLAHSHHHAIWHASPKSAIATSSGRPSEVPSWHLWHIGVIRQLWHQLSLLQTSRWYECISMN